MMSQKLSVKQKMVGHCLYDKNMGEKKRQK